MVNNLDYLGKNDQPVSLYAYADSKEESKIEREFMSLPEYLKQGEAARLFPVLSETSKEGRTTSIVLACMAAFIISGCDDKKTCVNDDGIPKKSAEWINENLHSSAKLRNVVDLGEVGGKNRKYAIYYELESKLHTYGDRLGEGVWTALIDVGEKCSETLSMNGRGESGMISINLDNIN